MARKISRLREDIRRTDDLDQEWPTAHLVDGLGRMTATRKALVEVFQAQEATVISLRILMYVAILESEDPKSEYRITKLL